MRSRPEGNAERDAVRADAPVELHHDGRVAPDPRAEALEIVRHADGLLGEEAELARVTPAEEGVAFPLEDRAELVGHRVAHGVELRVAADHAGGLEHEHLPHEHAEAGRGEHGPVELPRAHLSHHHLLVAGRAARIEAEPHLAARALLELAIELLVRLGEGRAVGRERAEAQNVPRRGRGEAEVREEGERDDEDRAESGEPHGVH